MEFPLPDSQVDNLCGDTTGSRDWYFNVLGTVTLDPIFGFKFQAPPSALKKLLPSTNKEISLGTIDLIKKKQLWRDKLPQSVSKSLEKQCCPNTKRRLMLL